VKDGQRGRAEALVSRSDVSFRLDQKTAKFKAAIASREMQWSPSTEGKQKNQLVRTCANRVSLHKNNNNNNKRGQLQAVHRLHISVALQQKTENLKVAIPSRGVQWSALPEEKHKNQLAA
jgi:hypothetical protein